MKEASSKRRWVLAVLLALSMLITTVGLAGAEDRKWFKPDSNRHYGPESVGLSREGLERIDQAYNQLISDHKIAGTVILVARHGKIAHLKALGMADIEAKQPMRTDTMFRMASMTKAIVNVAALMEWERGAFKMDDPISKYIPQFKDPEVLIPDPSDSSKYTLVPSKREIAIWHLFTHTSGLAYSNFDEGSPQLSRLYNETAPCNGLYPVNFDNAENVRRLATLPLKFNPGESWTYGHSPEVLVRLVEVTSGMSIDTYLREKLFKPLGMNDTYFHVPWKKVSRIARPYEVLASGLRRMEDGVLSAAGYDPAYPYGNNTKLESGDSGLVSTVFDYYTFLQMMLNKGVLDGVRILQPRTVEMMTMNQTGNIYLAIGGFGVETIFGNIAPGQGYGLGVGVLVDPTRGWTWAHPGQWSWSGAWGTSFWVDPAEDLIILQMEQAQPWPGPGMFVIQKMAYDAIIK